jgi:hypothetical protein
LGSPIAHMLIVAVVTIFAHLVIAVPVAGVTTNQE